MPRVLSLQSHVTHGYVGNKCSTFPLQTLSFDVDPIHLVQFSNHTGYPLFKGPRLQPTELEAILGALDSNGFSPMYTHVLTGYCPSVEVLKVVEDWLRRWKGTKHRRKGVYVLDPVLGDNNKLYVPESLVPMYQALCNLADVIVPNGFEASLLSGMPVINSTSAALSTLSKLHALGPKIVVITSIDSFPLTETSSWTPLSLSQLFPSSCSSQSSSTSSASSVNNKKTSKESENLTCLLSISSSSTTTTATTTTTYAIQFPKLPGSFTGTGDLFASLFLGHLYHTCQKPKGKEEEASQRSNGKEEENEFAFSEGEWMAKQVLKACLKALSGVRHVLELTVAERQVSVPLGQRREEDEEKKSDEDEESVDVWKGKELRVVQGVKGYLEPEVCGLNVWEVVLV
ncbi:hypothetical protein HDV05_002102 [Chytridiales sp. JEL 0842]|nr:hypothetical protein HDV05_002102 [Chytridiales sp. JEL 0842]